MVSFHIIVVCLFTNHVTPLYPQQLALTSPTGGGRSVGKVRSRTEATEFCLLLATCLNAWRWSQYTVTAGSSRAVGVSCVSMDHTAYFFRVKVKTRRHLGSVGNSSPKRRDALCKNGHLDHQRSHCPKFGGRYSFRHRWRNWQHCCEFVEISINFAVQKLL
jgi:hypothetical protein